MPLNAQSTIEPGSARPRSRGHTSSLRGAAPPGPEGAAPPARVARSRSTWGNGPASAVGAVRVHHRVNASGGIPGVVSGQHPPPEPHSWHVLREAGRHGGMMAGERRWGCVGQQAASASDAARPAPRGQHRHPGRDLPHSRHVSREAGRLGGVMAGERQFAPLGLCEARTGIGPKCRHPANLPAAVARAVADISRRSINPVSGFWDNPRPVV